MTSTASHHVFSVCVSIEVEGQDVAAQAGDLLDRTIANLTSVSGRQGVWCMLEGATEIRAEIGFDVFAETSLENEMRKAIGDLRSAFHTAEADTPGWPEKDDDLVQFTGISLKPASDLLDLVTA